MNLDVPQSATGEILKQYPSDPAPNRALQASAFSESKAKTEFTQLGLSFMRVFILFSLILSATLGYL